MSESTTLAPLRVDLVTPTDTLDITQFVKALDYGYSTTPPWDTVGVTLEMPLHLTDKVIPGSRRPVGESSVYVNRPEPGFWVIIWLADWPNYRSPTAMAVGYVETITCGERDIPGISSVTVKGTEPLRLQCTGMLALAGKSNVRLAMSDEQNADGFIYSLESFKGAMQKHLGNLANQETGQMLNSLWKETIKVRGPWGQAGGRVSREEGGAGPLDGSSPAEYLASILAARQVPASQSAYAELGSEIPVAFNPSTFAQFSPDRSTLCRSVYGKQLFNVPAMLPESSLWQWMQAMFVPNSDVVELFATLDPSSGLGKPGSPDVTTALGRSLGNAQPLLCYRFKPFALHGIHLENIQKQTHTGTDKVTSTIPMAEKLNLFQQELDPQHAGWMRDYYVLRPTDIFSHSFSWNDADRVNLVFARPSVMAGAGSIRPFSQVGNVVIPDKAQFAHHGLRAFEVDWPYLAVQDLRETVRFGGASSAASAASTANVVAEVPTLLEDFKASWQTAYALLGDVNYSFSHLEAGVENAVLTGTMSQVDFLKSWNASRAAVPAGASLSVDALVAKSAETAQMLKGIAAVDPRAAAAPWDFAADLRLSYAACAEQHAIRQDQLALLLANDKATAVIRYGLPFAAAMSSSTAKYTLERMLQTLIRALKADTAILEEALSAYQALQAPKGVVPVTAQAQAFTAGGSVTGPSAFHADSTLTNEFSALNELLWSIVGEGERFASMTLTIRGRPLIRQGHYIEGDLGPRPSTDTIYRYFTGYIESVNHSFGVSGSGEWQSRTTMQLSRVWFSPNPSEYYTPLAASSLGNETRSEQPNQVLRGKSASSTNSGNPGKTTLWDLTGWTLMRQAYELPGPQVRDRSQTGLYPLKCFVLHHTGGSGHVRSTVSAWAGQNAVDNQGKKKEVASHFAVAEDGSVFMFYDPNTSVVNHCTTYKDPGAGTLRYVKNISAGIDLCGHFMFRHPTGPQYLSAQMLMQKYSKERGFSLKAYPLPARILAGDSSLRRDLITTEPCLKDGYSVFGHGVFSPKECPGKNVDLNMLASEPGFAFQDVVTSDYFDVKVVTDANFREFKDYLKDEFPRVVGW